MNIAQIIQQLKTERGRLDAAIALLQGSGERTRSGARHMSPAARARIAEGQRRRWAARKAGATPSSGNTATAKPGRGRRHMSAAARARIAAAQKARWARLKAQKKK